jgi:curved DNA-binding protein CbpA
VPRTIRIDDDLYARLGVAPVATTAEITAAFRTRAKAQHPDRNPDDAAAAEEFKALTQAYDVLTRPDLRAEYDRRRHDVPVPARPPARPPSAPAVAVVRHEPVFKTPGRARAAKWGGVALFGIGVAAGAWLATTDTGDGPKTITLWIVVVKLIVCGAILAGVGSWRLQRLRDNPPAPVTAR